MSLTVEEEDEEVTREEHGALKWAALGATAVVCWLVMPIGVGILLGMLLAFVTLPLYGRLKPRLGSGGAAASVVFGSGLLLAGTLFALARLFLTRGASLGRDLMALVGPGGMGGTIFQWLGRHTARFGITSDQLTERARVLAEHAVARTASEVENLVGALASSALGAFFAALTMHYMLRNWSGVSIRAQETFPLRPDYTRSLFVEFRRVGSSTLMGTLVTGLAQGVLATVGYWICGLPEPLFFGAATALASLVPAVGTMLIWVPAGVGLILTGHPVCGGIELAWGALFVVALSDYVIRPRLVGGETEVPSLVTFAALFGGVEVLGLEGLIVGPVLMSLAIAVLRLYANETRLRRHLPPRAGSPPRVQETTAIQEVDPGA